ncbi:MAG: hypothetical protein ACLGID_17520 [Gammaproteobacteria bacterium]
MHQMLKNYLRCHRGVKNRLKCSFTARKLRFSPVFALRWLPRQRFFNGLVAATLALKAWRSKHHGCWQISQEPMFQQRRRLPNATIRRLFNQQSLACLIRPR